jgi:neutral ceramidase
MPGSYPYYPVQTWQLGDQTLIVLGGEVVVDYVFRFREIFGNDLMIMGYANDVMAYIPSERILKEGGYEGKTSMWVYGHRGTWLPGIEEKIVAEVVRQVNLIKSK